VPLSNGRHGGAVGRGAGRVADDPHVLAAVEVVEDIGRNLDGRRRHLHSLLIRATPKHTLGPVHIRLAVPWESGSIG
jgi:hypothetical protein